MPCTRRRFLFGLLAVLPHLLAGCSGVSAVRSMLSSPNNALMGPAAELRQKAPEDMPRELNKRVTTPYTVEPGDVVLVQPADLDSPLRLPGDQPVLQDGTINLGRYGKLQIAGMTVEGIETAAKALIAGQTKEPVNVTARVVSRVSKVFYVLGEVNSPGAFQYTGRETVLDAIVASAGGLSERGSRQNIILSRPTGPNQPRVILSVCYHDIVQLGDTTTNYQLLPGDRVYVPARTIWEDLHSGSHHSHGGALSGKPPNGPAFAEPVPAVVTNLPPAQVEP